MTLGQGLCFLQGMAPLTSRLKVWPRPVLWSPWYVWGVVPSQSSAQFTADNKASWPGTGQGWPWKPGRPPQHTRPGSKPAFSLLSWLPSLSWKILPLLLLSSPPLLHLAQSIVTTSGIFLHHGLWKSAPFGF